MEPFEKLKKLPDTEKAKCFEYLLEFIRHVTDDSDDPEKNSNKKVSLETFWNTSTKNDVHASSEVSIKKKQKTLDSWLIKTRDDSPSEQKTGESSSTTEESSNQVLSSNVNNDSECLDSIQSTLTNVNSSEHNDNSVENTKRSDKTDSLEANTHITDAVTEKCKLRSNIRNTDPSSKLSKSKSSTKSSVSTDIGLQESNRELIQSSTINNCDVNHEHDASSENLISDHSNLVDKNDCQGVKNLNSYNKVTRSRRPRKRKSNAQELVQSTAKPNNVTVNNDFDINEKTASQEDNNVPDSLSLTSLSNWEAFLVLEQQCARFNLNIVDILQNENIQAILNNPEKLDYETVFFIKAFKSNNGKTLPVVHVVDSITDLCNTVEEIRKSQQ